MELLQEVALHIVQIVVSDAGLCLRVLFLVHVLVLCGFIDTLAAPIVGNVDAQEVVVDLLYMTALLVLCTLSVAEPYYMAVGMCTVGWVCTVAATLVAMARMRCWRVLVSFFR